MKCICSEIDAIGGTNDAAGEECMLQHIAISAGTRSLLHLHYDNMNTLVLTIFIELALSKVLTDSDQDDQS